MTTSAATPATATGANAEPGLAGVPPVATRSVHGVCHHDCPDSCGWVATVEDRPTGPVVVKLRGDVDHPYSRGELCPKVNRFVDRLYSPDRLLTPLRRVGPKGKGQFEPVSWGEALTEIAAKWTAVADAYGAEAIVPFADAGNQSVLAMEGLSGRFLNRLGASRVTGSICGATASNGTALTYGSGRAMNPLDIVHSRLILLWGTNTRLTNRHLWPFVEQARAAGAEVVVIDPIRTLTAEAADRFLQPLPGTDVALMLAMLHVLVRDGHVDHDYVTRHAVGFDELERHVADWTPARAAGICGIDAAEIERLATDYATVRPAAIRTLIGAEHHEHGAAFFRTLACLPVVTGAWKERGGGMARSVGTYTGDVIADLSMPELAAGRGRRPLQMNHIGRWLTDASLTPRVMSLLVWNANPLVTFPNTELIRAGLERDDLFCVVHEQFLTDTARYADIVLPATTQLEQLDFMNSWGSLHLTWNEPAIAPRGESVSNTELFRRLASAMGFKESELYTPDRALIDEALSTAHPHGAGITAERLEREHVVALSTPAGWLPYADGGFDTPDGRAHLAGDRFEALGLPRVPTWLPPQPSAYPLQLLSSKVHTRFLNASYSALPGHGDREGGPYLAIAAEDAACRGIADGDRVRVWNDRAELVLPARVSTRVRAGVVEVPFGWTSAQHPDGRTVNALTSDTLADHGGGVAYADTWVDVAPA